MNNITSWESIPLILNIFDTSKLMKLSTRAIQRLANSKKIPGFKV